MSKQSNCLFSLCGFFVSYGVMNITLIYSIASQELNCLLTIHSGRDSCSVWCDLPSFCIGLGILHCKSQTDFLPDCFPNDSWLTKYLEYVNNLSVFFFPASCCSSSSCCWRIAPDFPFYVLVWNYSFGMSYILMRLYSSSPLTIG